MDVESPRKSRRQARLRWLFTALVMACAGCSTYIGTTPQSFLRHARSNPDPNLRYIAYAKLGNPDLYDHPAMKAQAVDTLIAKLEEGREPVAARMVIIRSLGRLGDRRARNAIAKVANNANAEAMLRVEAYRALGMVGTSEDAMTLVRIMNTDQLEDCRIAAIEGIAALKSRDPRIYDVLIEGMENEDPAIRLQSYRALKQITGKDPGNRPDDWRKVLKPELAKTEKPTIASGIQPGHPPGPR